MNHPAVKKLLAFIDNFIYSLTNELIVGLGVVFITFVVLIILSSLLNKNKPLSITFLSLALGVIIAGPIVANEYVDKTYKTTEFKQLEIRQLFFQDGIVIKGFLVNRSKKLLTDCSIKAKIYSKTDSEFGKFMGLIKPKSFGQTKIKKEIYPDRISAFRIYARNIKFSDDVDVSLKVKCR